MEFWKTPGVFKVDIETMRHDIDTLHPLGQLPPWPFSMLGRQVQIEH